MGPRISDPGGGGPLRTGSGPSPAPVKYPGTPAQMRSVSSPFSPRSPYLLTHGHTPKNLENVELHPALDENNPFSLVRLVPDPDFHKALNNLFEKEPGLFGLPYRELKSQIKTKYAMALTDSDHRLRMNFWLEYDNAMMENRPVQFTRIYSGIMHREYFLKYIEKPALMAFLLCPVADYAKVVEEAAALGMDKMREILDLDPRDAITGKLNGKILELQVKVAGYLDMRKNGAFTQKIENKNLNISTTIGAGKSVAAEISALSMDEVEKRIKRLETAERDALKIEKRATITVDAE